MWQWLFQDPIQFLLPWFSLFRVQATTELRVNRTDTLAGVLTVSWKWHHMQISEETDKDRRLTETEYISRKLA